MEIALENYEICVFVGLLEWLEISYTCMQRLQSTVDAMIGEYTF